MSKIVYTKDDSVLSRDGEFYKVGSCYSTPRHIGQSTVDEINYKADALIFWTLFSDVDELTNKPRRFFDHMLSLVEYLRDNDVMIEKGNRKQYWQEMIKGCEMWLSAVENGLYEEVEKLAESAPPKEVHGE